MPAASAAGVIGTGPTFPDAVTATVVPLRFASIAVKASASPTPKTNTYSLYQRSDSGRLFRS